MVQGDATHGEVAGESGRAVGVWSSDMSEAGPRSEMAWQVC